jgi:Fe-S-cluster containining protein
MNRKSGTKKCSLRSGALCVKYKCIHCCIETRMPLSGLDIKRILKLDYWLEDFAIKTKEGWQLKNRFGRCVFLLEGGCKIYRQRPEGCKLYPLVYDENSGKMVLDNLCPYRYEFKLEKDDNQKLKSLLEGLEKED